MKKVVKAVVIGVGIATVILTILKIVKKVGKKNEDSPRCCSDWLDYCDGNAIGI